MSHLIHNNLPHFHFHCAYTSNVNIVLMPSSGRSNSPAIFRLVLFFLWFVVLILRKYHLRLNLYEVMVRRLNLYLCSTLTNLIHFILENVVHSYFLDLDNRRNSWFTVSGCGMTSVSLNIVDFSTQE
jgi:hypothetical protein